VSEQDPRGRLLGGFPGNGGNDGTTPTAKPGMIGVDDDWSVPAVPSDYFKPGGSVQGNPLSGGNVNGGGMSMPTNAPHLPQYRDGAEQAVRRMSVENIARLQGQLSKAGLIGPETKFRVGMPDSTTVSAYKKLLETANNYAISDVEALNLLATTPQARGDGKTRGANGDWTSAAERAEAKRAAADKEAKSQAEAQAAANVDLSAVRTQTSRSEAMLTDPLTARETVRRVMETELGRAPDAAEYKRFVANLRDQEAGDDVSTTTSVYGRKGRLKSSSTARADDTQDVTPDVLASQMVRSGALGKERNTKMAGVDYYQAAMSVLGAGGGNL